VPQRTKAPRPPTTKPGITVLPISCASCGARSWVTLPGTAPWPGAVFQDKGWTVLNEPEEGHVVFACRTCFEREMNSHSPKIKGEG